MTREQKLERILYRAIVELEYVQESAKLGGEYLNLCATPVGEEIVEEGMALLGVKDLSAEEYPATGGTE